MRKCSYIAEIACERSKLRNALRLAESKKIWLEAQRNGR